MNLSVVLLLVAEGLSEAIVSLGELAALALAASFPRETGRGFK
jgi:hypothetical protein